MADEPIRSRQNQWIKRVRKAIDQHDDEIVLEGPKMIGDAIDGGWSPLVILQEDGRPSFRPDALIVDNAVYRELASTRTSQGVIALFTRPEESVDQIVSRAPRRIVALDSIQDPGNVGTIIRSAAAFGLSGVVCLPGTADPWAPKAIRSSAGAVLSIPVARCSIETMLGMVRDHDLEVYTADARGSETSISSADGFIVIFGSEGRGVSSELAAVSRGIRIPMSERVESLNVGAAAAIILSTLYRPSDATPG